MHLLAMVLSADDLDPEIARRVQWLKWGLEGYDTSLPGAWVLDVLELRFA